MPLLTIISSKLSAARLVLYAQLFLACLAFVSCLLHAASFLWAKSESIWNPFHTSQQYSKSLSYIIPPGCIFLGYVLSSISLWVMRPITPESNDTKQKLRSILKAFRPSSRISKYGRPTVMIAIALYMGLVNIFILGDIAIYDYLGKVASIMFPRTICLVPDGLCIVYKIATCGSVSLSVLVTLEAVVSIKYHKPVVEEEEGEDNVPSLV